MSLVRRLDIFSFLWGVLFLSLFLPATVTASHAHESGTQRVTRSSHKMNSHHYPLRLLSTSSRIISRSNCPAAAFLFCRQNTPSSLHRLRGGAKSPLSSYLSISSSTRRYFPTESEPHDNDSTSPAPQPETTKSKSQRHCISYLTDVEGDRNYLQRFVQQSRILTFRPTESRRARPPHENSSATIPDDGTTSTASTATTSTSTSTSTCTFPDYFPYDHCLDFLNSNDMLVYGGDVWDQGGSDLYVIRQLLDLHRRHPHRVHLVMGNRDMNKMRMIQELGERILSDDIDNDNEKQQQQPLPPHGGVYWLRGSGVLGDPDEGLLPNDNAADRLRWMLGNTMGSPKAFEHRRYELQQEMQGQPVTDEHVVESYRASCHPVTGEMGRYLGHARLIVRLGDALFVHGSLPLTEKVLKDAANTRESVWDDLTFAMPWLQENETAQDNGVLTIADWITAINDFCVENVRAWREEPSCGIWSMTGGYNHNSKASQPFSQLVQYGMGWVPGGIRNPTVVYSSWCSHGMPRRFFPSSDDDDDDDGDDHNSTSASTTNRRFVQATREFFQRSGVTLICSGHQPQGDMPNPIRVDYTTATTGSAASDTNTANKNTKNTAHNDNDLNRTQPRTGWILSCDTSYSGDTGWLNLPTDHDDDNNCTNSSSSSSSDVSRRRHNPGRGHAMSGRGEKAVSEIVMEQCSETGQIRSVFCHGTLSDGTAYETCELDLDGTTTTTTTSPDLVVGKLAMGPLVPDKAHPWWTRAAFRDGSYLLTTGEGYDAWNRIVKP